MNASENSFQIFQQIRFLWATCLFSIVIFSSDISAATFSAGSISELQAALNTAAVNSENDTINLSSGTYSVSSTIRFWSEEEFSILITGESSPILDGGNSTQIMELITVSAAGHIALDGLIFQNGHADYGGAVYAETENGDISITNCTLTDNAANYVCGGANLYSIAGNIRVSNCIFRKNTSPNTSGYPYGTAGALFVQTEGEGPTISVTDCIFEENTAQRDAAGAMLYPMGYKSTVIVRNNRFSSNTANEFGGGCWIRCPNDSADVEYFGNIVTENSAAEAGSGGGTYIQITSGRINFTDNVHVGNSAVWQGGGLWIEHGGGTLIMQNNQFSENHAVQNGGGANVFIENGNVSISRNIFYNNQASESGGGLCFSTTSGELNIFNNTFFSNAAADGGDTYFYFDNPSANVNFYNNILYQSTSPALSFSGAQTVVAKYSDIDGGTGASWFGAGCLDSDPKFSDAANGDFHLTWQNFPTPDGTKSPCIDTGDPASAHDPDGSVADMGALYFDQTTGIMEKISDIKVNRFQLLPNYPNPFNSSTAIKFSISKPEHITLSVYNVSGQLIAILVDEFKTSGSYSVVWNAGLVNSGIYFCKLEAGQFKATRKLFLIK
ncbi:MAG: T9SS type A sorting domain-containing protein [Calditrichaeota bacterium]|nr:T9SS type A sorting domain-containing protein [Calditrichota bacterium]